MEKSNITLLDLLGVLFIGLKLSGNITCSWAWVLLPLWLPISVVLLAGILYALKKTLDELED